MWVLQRGLTIRNVIDTHWSFKGSNLDAFQSKLDLVALSACFEVVDCVSHRTCLEFGTCWGHPSVEIFNGCA